VFVGTVTVTGIHTHSIPMKYPKEQWDATTIDHNPTIKSQSSCGLLCLVVVCYAWLWPVMIRRPLATINMMVATQVKTISNHGPVTTSLGISNMSWGDGLSQRDRHPLQMKYFLMSESACDGRRQRKIPSSPEISRRLSTSCIMNHALHIHHALRIHHASHTL
jgi:hypothetical protein